MEKNLSLVAVSWGLKIGLFLSFSSIPDRYQTQLWLPQIEFDNTDKIIKEFQPELFITKLAAASVDGEIDEINTREVY